MRCVATPESHQQQFIVRQWLSAAFVALLFTNSAACNTYFQLRLERLDVLWPSAGV
jgi:hypothetical protein